MIAVTPLIGVSACVKRIEQTAFHAVGDKYLKAILDSGAGQPVMVPAFGTEITPKVLLGRLDGLMLTGSPSNVHPERYGGAEARPEVALDPRRDATVLPLIDAALGAGVPLLAICRGIQELNVALGGTLHQHLHEVPGRFDHRRPADQPYAKQYDPTHPIAIRPGSPLHRIAGATEARVNSLHGQGLDRVAPGLDVDATAPDGTVEAVSVTGARAFAIGVQWHPEWRVGENPFYLALFRAFGEACRRRAHDRVAHHADQEVA